mgnify:CR=1 FL=1
MLRRILNAVRHVHACRQDEMKFEALEVLAAIASSSIPLADDAKELIMSMYKKDSNNSWLHQLQRSMEQIARSRVRPIHRQYILQVSDVKLDGKHVCKT